MSIKTSMEAKLQKAFSPQMLRIIDESSQHHGHAGFEEGSTESHMGIVIVSADFAGKSRVDRSRAVHSVIADEIKQIHALTVLKTLTPEEYEKLPKAL